MKETRGDNARSLALALLLHLLIFGLAFAGLEWTRRTAEPMGGGPAVEAEVVDAAGLSARMQAALADRVPSASVAPVDPEPPVPETPMEPAPPPPKPESEPPDAVAPQPAAPAPPEDRPETRDQDEARRDAQSRETREREQEEKRKERQVELQKQQQQAAEEKKRQAERQEADARAKAEAETRRKRAASLAAQRAQQLEDAQARAAADSGPASGAGQGKDSTAEWLERVVAEIERQWRRPDDIPRGQKCPIRIKLLPGGEVLSAEVQPSCPYSEANRRTVEAAVKKASPLPLKGNEDLRLRDFVVNFYPSR